MKAFFIRYKSRFFVPAAVGFLLIMSCERKIDTVKNSEILTLPVITRKNFETIFTDSGKVQLIMSAPLMEYFKNTDDPYYEFKSGLKISFFDGNADPVAFATSKYARNSEKKNLWELKDSVVLINEANEKLETEQLFWDEGKDMIYTDRFVKITREDQTIMGTGFESDSRLLSPKIKRVTATIYLRDE